MAVVIGNTGHSVLDALGATVEVPRVVLRKSVAEQDDPITRPRSSEVPQSESDSRYQLQGEIARGGMGAILKGRDTDLGRDLAIKVLLDSHKARPEVIQRFVEEAQIGGQLQHPGIAPVYELGQFDDKRPFFAMKLVTGETLSKLLADREDPAAERVRFVGIFEQVCQTMAYAHSRGVIHRDLKPANIMVGAFGEVQVMDWGLAKVLSSGGVADEKKSHDRQQGQTIIQTLRSGLGSGSPESVDSAGSQTQMGSVMGTPAYMPPEQALGEIDQLDERADVFGLGAILCEILTGQPPYVGTDGSAVYRQASRGELGDCKTRLDSCGADEDLIALTKHCLELEPSDRPRDAGVLAERITGYLESVEVKLRETEMARANAQIRAEELRRRQKLAFTASAVIVATLVIGISVSIWQAFRATTAETLAIGETERAIAAEKAAEDETARATQAEKVAKAEAISATAAEKQVTKTLVKVAAERDAKQQALKEAEAVASFLSEILESPDPSRDGRTFTVVEVLDKAAKGLDASLADQPDQLARMQTVLGRTYYGLGLFHEAIPLREKARKYYLTQFGPEYSEVIEAGIVLAGLYHEVGRLDEALKLREEVLAKRRKLFGSEHPDTLAAMQGLAHSYESYHRHDESLRLREEMLAGRRKLHGPDHLSTLSAMDQVAGSYHVAGRLQDALAMREQTTAAYRKHLGPTHPTLLWGMHLLARSYYAVGRHDEAMKLREETLALRRSAFGPEHPRTIDSMSALADSRDAVGRAEEALILREEVLAFRRKTFGPEHSVTFWAMHSLANSYLEFGRLAEKTKLHEEMLTISLKMGEPDWTDSKRLRAILVQDYLGTGRTREAIPLLAEIVFGKPEDTLTAMKLAALQVWFGMDADYAGTRQRMLQWVADKDDPDPSERVAKIVCMRPISDTETLAAALALARRGTEGGQAKKHFMPWYQQTLGMAEYRNGNYENAATVLSHAAEIASQTGSASQQARVTGTSSFYRVMSLFQDGKQDEAIALFAKTTATMKPLPADDQNPLADKANQSDLILWLAYREAKALLAQNEIPAE